MAKNQAYIYKFGARPVTVVSTWNEVLEAQKQRDGSKDGYKYRGFVTRAEAEAFADMCNKKLRYADFEDVKLTSEYQGFSDGSNNSATGDAGFGAIIVQEGEIKAEFSCRVKGNPTDWQIAGEAQGAIRLMDWCIEKGAKSMDLVFDYLGVGASCLGIDKATDPELVALKAKYDEATKKGLDVHFVWVGSHATGLKNEIQNYNDRVDVLAKQAVGLA